MEEQKISLVSEDILERFKEYSNICLRGGWVQDGENIQTKRIIKTIEANETGALILGNPGSGKTLLCEMIRNIINPEAEYYFIIINVNDFVLRFNKDGHQLLRQYENKNLMIDDLGTEEKGLFYKEQSEVFALFIQLRYVLFKQYKIKTHFTSNLTFADMEARYGLRVVSRIKEMTDTFLIGSTKNYTDRRQYRNFISLPKVFYLTNEIIEARKLRQQYDKAKEEAGKREPNPNKSLGDKVAEILKIDREKK